MRGVLHPHNHHAARPISHLACPVDGARCTRRTCLSSHQLDPAPGAKQICRAAGPLTGAMRVEEVASHHISISRREALAAALLAPVAVGVPGAAAAETLTVEAVTPAIAPASPLSPREQQVIDVFDRNTYSVVNVIDITLQGRGSFTPEVDIPEGNGSGIVWNTQGDIVTNYHVLGNVLKGLGNDPLGKRVARVTLLGQNGLQQTYDGQLVGLDKARDLAVLRINAQPDQLRPVSLGTSTNLRVGQQVFAIGCPFGFDHTLTTGVVSGLNREIRSIIGASIPGGIQTDAAINPGNSGGPLLDSSGALVGLNTAIFTNTGTSVGVGFAIPVDTVARVVPQLISNGRVVRPSLGVQLASANVAARLKVTQGALIQGVQPGSAAQKAGLLPTRRGLAGIITGDVILQVDNTTIAGPTDLTNVLDLLQVGQKVMLRVLRTGEGAAPTEITVQAELGSE